jgi:hypothetical protein
MESDSPPPDVSTGLATAPMTDADPPALRVTGLDWFSGLRGSGLRPGDRIVAVDGAAIAPVSGALAQREIGGYDEPRRWAEAGRGAGAPVALTVRRRATPGRGWLTLDVTGTLQPADATRAEDGRQLLGPGGPPAMYEYDGFDRGWRDWADDFAKSASAVLDDPLCALSLTTSYELKLLEEQRRPRVELLVSKYPGPFADAVKQDFDAMRERLQGPDIALPGDALAYRALGEQRADEVREQARAAWQALQAELGDRLVAPLFPAVNPIHGDRVSVVGRYAQLPPLRNRDWIGEAGRTWFVAGSGQDGFYFVDAEGPAAVAMQDALARYRRLVMPGIDESYELVGQVQPQPGHLVVGERAWFGLQLEPAAALVGGSMFVDLRALQDGRAPFAGEDALHGHAPAPPPDDAGPAEVLQAMVAALKAADQDLWLALFATWSVETLSDGRTLFRANAQEQPERYFEEARRRIMERVHDMGPVWVDDVRVVVPGDRYPGQLRIEETTVEMRHVGCFDGRYRPFSDVTVHRWWRLQRLGAPGAMGPWRIVSLQPI